MTIRTPDQRVRVFVSSTMRELAAERAAVRAAVERLRLTPVLFELGARPHPPKELYLAYLRQSHVFLGMYFEQYGWVAPGETLSGLEDEYLAATDQPKLIYVKSPAPGRHQRLTELLDRISNDGLSYRHFSTPEELAALVADDLAVLLSERFGAEEPSETAAVAAPRTWPLPVQANRMVGRSQEIADLQRLLTGDGARLVTLVGPGGIGKTRLALAAAEAVQPEFPDGVVPVMLAAVRAAEHVPSTIATVLGLPETFGRAPLEMVADFLRSRRIVLLLDNMEQVVDAAPVVARLIAEAPQLRVLVTSREVLHLTGERVFPVPPLSVGDPRDPVSLEDSAAVQLFLDRARAARPDLVADAARLRTIGEICRRIDGLPLAIELAAARMRILQPEDILRRLDRKLVLLTGGPRDVAARQQALKATVQWSWDLLDERDRRLFARLGVFAGGFFLDAAEAVCGDDDLVVDVLDGLASLVDKSLVRADPSGGEMPHFAMLETVREFAVHCLNDLDEVDRIQQAHAEFFERVALVGVEGLGDGGPGHSWNRMTADADNIRAALRWWLEQDEPDRIARMGEGVWPVWWGWSVFDEGTSWMRAALGSPGLTDEGRALAEFVTGVLAFGHGNPSRAVPSLVEARRLHEELGDQTRAAVDSILLGVAVGMKDPAAGERMERRAVAVLREQRADWKYAFALFALGRVLVLSGRPEEALPVLEESVRLGRRRQDGALTGPHPLVSYAIVNLGWARLGVGDVAGSRAAFRDALVEAGNADEQVRARALEALASVALHDQDAHLGAVLFGGAESVRRSIGIGVWPTDVTSHRGTEAALRAALGAEAYEASFGHGLRLTPDELTAIACGEQPADPPAATTGVVA